MYKIEVKTIYKITRRSHVETQTEDGIAHDIVITFEQARFVYSLTPSLYYKHLFFYATSQPYNHETQLIVSQKDRFNYFLSKLDITSRYKILTFLKL